MLSRAKNKVLTHLGRDEWKTQFQPTSINIGYATLRFEISSLSEKLHGFMNRICEALKRYFPTQDEYSLTEAKAAKVIIVIALAILPAVIHENETAFASVLI